MSKIKVGVLGATELSGSALFNYWLTIPGSKSRP